MTGAVPALRAGTETTVQQDFRQAVVMELTMMEVNIFPFIHLVVLSLFESENRLLGWWKMLKRSVCRAISLSTETSKQFLAGEKSDMNFFVTELAA